MKLGPVLSTVTLMILGALADHYLLAKIMAPSPQEESPLMGMKPDCAQAESDLLASKKKVAALAVEDFQAYINSPSDEAKLKKADELLIKVIPLLVTDLGLQLDPKDLEKLNPPQAP